MDCQCLDVAKVEACSSLIILNFSFDFLAVLHYMLYNTHVNVIISVESRSVNHENSTDNTA